MAKAREIEGLDPQASYAEAAVLIVSVRAAELAGLTLTRLAPGETTH